MGQDEQRIEKTLDNAKDAAKMALDAWETTCEFHRSPFDFDSATQVMWVAAFCIELFKWLMSNKEFQIKCEGKTENVTKNMPNPLCCHIEQVDPSALMEIYEKIGVEIPVKVNIH